MSDSDDDEYHEYSITGALKPPRATSYTAQALFDQIISNDIDLEPEYQRDVVWPELKQIGLIDSIFRNYYIPPVIFAVTAHGDGSETRVCIDGKQRLTSIYRFMLGLIPHHDRVIGSKHWYQDSNSSTKRRNILPERYRKLFCNKQIVCIEYSDITDRDEREIFQRVQLGMALTPAEKLAVVKTPRADFIRYLQNRFFSDDLPPSASSSPTTSLLSWDRSRGNDFRCLATALYALDRYQSSASTSSVSPTITVTPTIMQLEKWLSDKSIPVQEDLSIFVSNAFNILSSLSSPSSPPSSSYTKQLKRAVTPPKIAPIEFITIALLVMIVHSFMEPEEILTTIGDMREDVRNEHVDIRMNSKVGKTLSHFVARVVERCGAFEAEKLKPKPEPKPKTKANAKTKSKSKAKPKEKKKVQVEEEEIDELMDVDQDNPTSPIIPPPSTTTSTNNLPSLPSSSSTSPTPPPIPKPRAKQTVRKSTGGQVPRKIIRPSTPESESDSDSDDDDGGGGDSEAGSHVKKRKASMNAEFSDKPSKLSKTSTTSTSTSTPIPTLEHAIRKDSIGLAGIRSLKAKHLQRKELEKANELQLEKGKEREQVFEMQMEIEKEEDQLDTSDGG